MPAPRTRRSHPLVEEVREARLAQGVTLTSLDNDYECWRAYESGVNSLRSLHTISRIAKRLGYRVGLVPLESK